MSRPVDQFIVVKISHEFYAVVHLHKNGIGNRRVDRVEGIVVSTIKGPQDGGLKKIRARCSEMIKDDARMRRTS